MPRVSEARRIGLHVMTARTSLDPANRATLATSIEYLVGTTQDPSDRWKHYISGLDLKPRDWQNWRPFVETELETTVEQLAKALRAYPSLEARVRDLDVGDHAHRVVPHDEPPHRRGTGGTNRPTHLRRLSRDRPDLLARVEEGELTVYGAAIEAGWTRRKGTFYTDNIASYIRVGRKHFSADEIRAALDAYELKETP